MRKPRRKEVRSVDYFLQNSMFIRNIIVRNVNYRPGQRDHIDPKELTCEATH